MKASIVSAEVLPFSFSSRLTLVTAAERPINTAKTGSATLEIIYVGGGMVIVSSTFGMRVREKKNIRGPGSDCVGFDRVKIPVTNSRVLR